MPRLKSRVRIPFPAPTKINKSNNLLKQRETEQKSSASLLHPGCVFGMDCDFRSSGFIRFRYHCLLTALFLGNALVVRCRPSLIQAFCRLSVRCRYSRCFAPMNRVDGGSYAAHLHPMAAKEHLIIKLCSQIQFFCAPTPSCKCY